MNRSVSNTEWWGEAAPGGAVGPGLCRSYRWLRPWGALTLVLGLGCSPGGSSDATGQTEGGASESGQMTDTETGESGATFSPGEIDTILTWLGPLPAAPPPDPTNAYADDPGAAVLGQILFFETGFSGNGMVSCATCHVPQTGFADGEGGTSVGIDRTGRSTMSVLNSGYGSASEAETNWQYWDGRCDSPWCQALVAAENDIDMGGARSDVAVLIFDQHRAQYEAVFGSMPELRDAAGDSVVSAGSRPGDPEWEALSPDVRDGVTQVFVNFGKAVAAYERRLISRGSRFDQLWEELAGGAEDSDALTEQEKQGLRVFIGSGRCLGCHGGPNFTDGQFHNIAVPQEGDDIATSDPGRAEGLAEVIEQEFNCAGPWSDHPDKGTCAVSTLEMAMGELGAFKTPSLRGIASTAPYMHTGNFASLDSVVRHYDIGGAPSGTFDGTRDELMRPVGLTAAERRALVAFMEALEGEPIDSTLMSAP